MGRPNFGHIQRVGHERYRVFWGRGYRPDGTRDRHSATVHGTRAEAEVFLASKVSAQGAPAPDQTWEVFWLAHVEPTFDCLAKQTVDKYRYYWDNHLKPHIANVKVCDTDEALVDSVLCRVKSPAVQRHVKDLWRKACRIAVRRRMLDRCPIDAHTPLKPMRQRPKRLLDASEVFGWLDGIDGIRHEVALLCMLGGGLRPEEAYGLHYEDIQDVEVDGRAYLAVRVCRALTYSNGKILKETKNGFSEREVIIGSPFRARILKAIGRRESENVATGIVLPSGLGVDGDPASFYTSPSTVCSNYKLWCERNGIVYVAPKNLRASYATLHGEAGSPDSLVSGSMGHSDGTTRGRHYQAITRRGLALIADCLGEYLEQFRTSI